MSGGGGSRCAAVLPDLAELALGISVGEERARALDHLDDCASCAAELVALSAAADHLASAVPDADPPVDFAPSVLARISRARGDAAAISAASGARAPAGPVEGPEPAAMAPGDRRPSRRRRQVLVGVAALAACAALLGGVILLRLGQPSRSVRTPGAGAVAGQGARGAALVAAGTDVGSVVAYAGTEPSLLVTVRGLPAGSSVVCDVTTDAGQSVRLGSFWLASGNGSWAAGLPVEPRALRSAQVMTPDGVVLARASFRSSSAR